MLGSKTEAEDIVQEVLSKYWERQGKPVQDEKGYLVKAAMNEAISRYHRLKEERERYTGPWLPEPLYSEDGGSQLPGDRDQLRLGWLKLLEGLDPFERAVIVLREALGFEYEAIAAFIARSEAHCRQLLKRGKEKLQKGPGRTSTGRENEERYVQAFLKAAEEGDPSELKELLRADMVFYSDGGGKVPAALKPVHGSDAFMSFIQGILSQQQDLRTEFRYVNGSPAMIAYNGDELDSVTALELTEDGAAIEAVHTLRNPDKIRS